MGQQIIIDVQFSENQQPRNKLFYKVDFYDWIDEYYDSQIFPIEELSFESVKDGGSFFLKQEIQEVIEHYQRHRDYAFGVLKCKTEDEATELEAGVENWPCPEYQMDFATPKFVTLQAYSPEGLLYEQKFEI